ncbi:MAG: tetratricopeptide repeat protein [Nitrospirota bacterium]|nr:tetratricopeptide repeat protein [Nitrospirota bacterium]
MRTALILMSLVIFSAMLSPARAEEELFDTKAAAAYREQGVNLLKQKNYDAAIDALEDAVASAPDAESYYLLGYAYYIKGKKTGDAESRMKAVENFNQAYQINPNFSPNKFKPEDITMPAAGQTEEQPLGAAAPEKQAPQPASAATTTAEQQKQQ